MRDSGAKFCNRCNAIGRVDSAAGSSRAKERGASRRDEKIMVERFKLKKRVDFLRSSENSRFDWTRTNSRNNGYNLINYIEIATVP